LVVLDTVGWSGRVHDQHFAKGAVAQSTLAVGGGAFVGTCP
jgi:hypothetical protein